ncbi:MAG: PAS domain S-box protein, partial [Dehalococcoidia bacterium]|nr:PAS domain S-box protein [Dehalococcoidia bacterium]
MASHRLHNREGITSERKRMEEALRKGEEQYRLLTENVTDVIYTMDVDLRFTYVSPSVTRQLGYSVEEVMPFSLKELLTPASFEVAMKAWAEELAIENMEQKDLNRSRVLELEMRCKDGSTVWTEMSITFLRDPDGMAVGILGVARDISERKRAEEALREAHDMLGLRVEERTAELVQEIEERKKAEEALRESEEKLRVMFESTSEGIAVTDLKGKILDVNDATLRMSGLSREDLVGKDGLALMPREDTKKIIGHGTKALKKDTGAEKMIEEITPMTGREYDVGLSMGVLRDRSGDPTGFVAIVRDITER